MNNNNSSYPTNNPINCNHPESMNLDVKTMRFSRMQEQKETIPQNQQKPTQTMFNSFSLPQNFNISSLLSSIKDSPFLSQLSNNNLFSSLLKSSLFSNQNGQSSPIDLQTLTNLLKTDKIYTFILKKYE